VSILEALTGEVTVGLRGGEFREAPARRLVSALRRR